MANPRLAAGFSLVEVMIAVVLLGLVTAVAVRAIAGATEGVAIGRRLTAMAWAAESEMVRLEREYRRGSPACGVPVSGSRVTPDGIGLDWTVTGDSVRVRIAIEVRAAAARRSLRDSLTTTIRCR
jgi:prepilin-type N-terminal cleavage/methylation domain-containing protein